MHFMLLFLTGCLKYGPVQTKYDDVDKKLLDAMSMYMHSNVLQKNMRLVFLKRNLLILSLSKETFTEQKSILIVRSKVLIRPFKRPMSVVQKIQTKMESMTMLISVSLNKETKMVIVTKMDALNLMQMETLCMMMLISVLISLKIVMNGKMRTVVQISIMIKMEFQM